MGGQAELSSLPISMAESNCILLRDLPDDHDGETSKRPVAPVVTDDVMQFLEQHIPENRVDGLADSMKYQSHFLDNVERARKKKFNISTKKKRKTLTVREKRELGLFKIPKEQDYVAYLPLNDLWENYIRDLLQLDK